MDNKKKNYIILLSLASLCFAIFLDILLPVQFILSTLYAIPILIIATNFKPKIIILIGFISILCYITVGFERHTHFVNIALHSAILTMIVFLSVRLAEERLRSQKYAELVNRSKSQLQMFINMISHDLSHPVTALKMYSQFLMTTKFSNSKRKTILNNVADSIEQMQRLIEDLRDANLIGIEEFSVFPKTTDLIDILRNIKEVQETKQHHITLSSPKYLRGKWDKQRLNQLFTNLVSNAKKYSPDGQEINIKVENTKKDLVVAVSDHGFGLTQAQINSLFQPFSRHHKTKAKGLGLGLYISKAIVGAHNGKIWVESKKGKGSTFFVMLSLTNKYKITT